MEKIVVFTDGACSGNPGPGGWASIIVRGHEQVQELGEADPQTTNNRMEIAGVLEALKWIQKKKMTEEIQVYTDSVYVLRGIQQWVWGWARNNWKTAEGKEVLNQDLWKEFLTFFQSFDRKRIQWFYCPGHAGIPGNERCDEIAVAYSKGERPYLYSGLLEDYSVDIMNLPPPRDLPEMKPKGEKKKATSYLSYVNGVLTRHPDWASCERTVKGMPGAKFKKAHSENEENEIILSWGLNPQVIKK